MNASITPTDEESDFFSSPVAPAPAAQAPAAAAALTAPSNTSLKPGLHTKIKPYHAAAGMFLLASAVLFGNPFAGTSKKQSDPNTDALTTGPRYVAGADGDVQAATAEAAQAHSSNVVRDATPALQQPPQPVAAALHSAPPFTSAAATVPAGALTERTAAGELAALRAQLTAVKSELVGLRADLATARAAQASVPRPRMATPTAQSRPSGTARSEHSRRAETADRGVLTGFRINTIYPGQAWIEVGQRTFLVEPGTVLDGMRVTRIDPVARRVQTTQGDIL